MTPKVYGVIGSPPFSAVLICAEVLGIEIEIEKMDVFNMEHFKGDFIKINPQNTIPLLDDNGFILADSHAINGYLVGTYGKENDSLYPKDDIKRRAIIDHRLYMDASIIAARGFLVSKPYLFNRKPTQEAFDALKDAFSILDKQIQLQNTEYMAGNSLSIADFSITTSVMHWGALVSSWETEFPNLKAYIDRMKLEKWFEICQRSLIACRKVFAKALSSLEECST